MDKSLGKDLVLLWRLTAAVLIYPATVAAGLGALVRIVAGCCVGMAGWTPDGALSNLALGFPTLAGIAALWLATIHPAGWLARDRVRFVLVTTGLLTGLIMEILLIRAGLSRGSPRFRSPGLMELWTLGGPIVVGAIHLWLIIRAREAAFVPSTPAHSKPAPMSLAGPHFQERQVLQPVTLRPYRPTRADWPPSTN